MGKITELIQHYRAGKLDFEELKQKLVEFEWQDLKWPSRHGDDHWMATDYPEENTLEELDAAQDDELLTDEEFYDLYVAIVGETREEA